MGCSCHSQPYSQQEVAVTPLTALPVNLVLATGAGVQFGKKTGAMYDFRRGHPIYVNLADLGELRNVQQVQ